MIHKSTLRHLFAISLSLIFSTSLIITLLFCSIYSQSATASEIASIADAAGLPAVSRNAQASIANAEAHRVAAQNKITVTKSVNKRIARNGDTLTYMVRIDNSLASSTTVTLTDTLGAGLSPVTNTIPGTLVLPIPLPNIQFAWTATLTANQPITIPYNVIVSHTVTSEQRLVNEITLLDGGNRITATAWISTYSALVALPIIHRPLIMLPNFANNGFEDQPNTYWIDESTNFDTLIVKRDILTTKVAPHTGDYVAWLGGRANEVSSLKSPAISIPTKFSTFYLRYWYWIASSENNCGNDTTAVRIDGAEIAGSRLNLCQANNTNAWRERCLVINDKQGQAVAFEFIATLNDAENSNFFLDDIKLSEQPCS